MSINFYNGAFQFIIYIFFLIIKTYPYELRKLHAL